MKTNTIIAIGGCHVEGYGADNQPSFVDHLSSTLNLDCPYRKGTFPLSKHPEINHSIAIYKPSYVLLQVGNYEFHASVKKLLKKKKSGRSSSTISGETIDSASSGAQLTIKDKRESIAIKLFRVFILPVLWLIIRKKVTPQLQAIQNIVRNNPNRRFILLSPFPSLKFPDNYVRKKGGQLINKMMGEETNVVFIDLFSKLPVENRLFTDKFHLNAKGHHKLAQVLTKELEPLVAAA